MIDPNEVLLELYAIRSDIERKFLTGSGDLDALKQVEEHIALEEKRIPKGAGFGPITTAPDLLSVKKKSKKICINIDYEKGIYRIIKGQPVRYPHVTAISKIFLVIKYLQQNGSSRLRDLAQHVKQQAKSTKRGIANFNKLSRAKLILPADPITGDGIYELNDTHFEFV